MQEELINLETAKLAKELGFDEETKYKQTDYYDDYIEFPVYECDSEDDFCREDYTRERSIWDEALPIPTQALLQKWIREKHKINVYPRTYSLENKEGEFIYRGVISKVGTLDAMLGVDAKYENVLEIVLFEALNIIKKRNENNN